MRKRDKGSLLGGAACTSRQKPHHCRIRALETPRGNALCRDWASGSGAGMALACAEMVREGFGDSAESMFKLEGQEGHLWACPV